MSDHGILCFVFFIRQRSQRLGLVCTNIFNLTLIRRNNALSIDCYSQYVFYCTADVRPIRDPWTLSFTGDLCYFDPSRGNTCAQCASGGCQCAMNPNQCVECGNTEACGKKVNMSFTLYCHQSQLNSLTKLTFCWLAHDKASACNWAWYA